MRPFGQATRRCARRLLRAVVRAGLRFRARSYPVEEEVRCLVIAPHEDDATLGCGGLMLAKRLEGNPVEVAYITDGSASHPGHPTLTPGELARRRRDEAHVALGRLGVERAGVHFLDAADGTLDRLDQATAEALVGRIAGLVGRVRPDEVFLPCRSDGSSEHDAAFLLVMEALRRSGFRPRLFEYPIWSLWSPARLMRPLVSSRRVWRMGFPGYEHLKARALGSYRTQMEPVPPWTEPVLPAGFASCFLSGEEFFFEMGDARSILHEAGRTGQP
jgi:LmbE family N-acetylglucosaminyl deacetylase